MNLKNLSSPNIVYLTGSDIHVIDSIIESQGWTPLSPNSVAILALDEDGIAGFHVMQMIQHAHPEPQWVRIDHRGTGLSERMAIEMNDFIKATATEGFMCIADSPMAVKLCESLGMKKITSPVYVR